MYTKRNLKFVITSQNGNFVNTDKDIMTISDCKSHVEIKAGTISAGGQAQITIEGLSAEIMAILSAKGVWAFSDARINYSIDIFADDNIIFSGLVYACFADMNKQPNCAITILANGAGALQKSNAPDFSSNGPVLVKDILTAICSNAKYSFVDLGVEGSIDNPHYSGNSLTQISRVCLDASLMYAVTNKSVTAWKAGNPSEMPEHYPVVSPDSGLIGYPVYLPSGLSIKSVFSPLFTLGGSLELKTSLPNTSGFYKIIGVTHSLSSCDPRGDWFSFMFLAPYADTLAKMRNRSN